MSPREPPATTTWPDVNFVPAASRPGTSAWTRAVSRPASGSIGAPGGIPMSMTRSSPRSCLPGAIQWPGFARANVAVADARTLTPAAAPVDASTPLGMSAATAGASRTAIASIASAARPSGSPRNPVPKIASTMTAASPSPATVKGSCSPSRRRRFSAASPRYSSGSASVRTRTRRPSWRSSRPATKPSPPLLPFPQTTATGPRATVVSVMSARPAPARSMRSSDGIPSSSIAQRSIARICSAPGSGSSQSGSGVTG